MCVTVCLCICVYGLGERERRGRYACMDAMHVRVFVCLCEAACVLVHVKVGD